MIVILGLNHLIYIGLSFKIALYFATTLFENLKQEYQRYQFRFRQTISKQEINEKLNLIDKRLGETLFVKDSKIKPDGGIIEVQDRNKQWRVVLVSEAKFQGKDVENRVVAK